MKKSNKAKSLMLGACLGAALSLPGMLKAATPTLPPTQSSSTVPAQSVITPSQPSSSTVISQPSQPSVQRIVPYDIRVAKLSDDAKKDIMVPQGKTLLDLAGSSALVVGDYDSKNGVALTPKEVVELFAGDKNPEHYIWIINEVDKAGKMTRRAYLYEKGKLYDDLTRTEFVSFIPTSQYQVMTDTLLKRINRSTGDDLKLTVGKNAIIRNKLENILFNKTYYTGKSKSKEEVKVGQYDGCYVVFNRNLRVGGTRGFYAQVKPYYELGEDTVVRDDTATRDLDLSPVAVDLENVLDKILKESASTGIVSKLPAEYVRLNAGYGSRADSVTTETQNENGAKIADDVAKHSASGMAANAEGRITFDNVLKKMASKIPLIKKKASKAPPVYVFGEGDLRALSGDCDLSKLDARVTAGVLGNRYGFGIGYAIANQGISNFDVGDNFMLDKTRNYSGPVLEAILKGKSTEAKVVAEFMKGKEEQTLRNSQVPDYERATTADNASLNRYRGEATKTLGRGFEAELGLQYSERNGFNSERDGELGAELRYRPWRNAKTVSLKKPWTYGKYAEFSLNAKLGKRLNPKPKTKASYQQLYGGAGFRF